MNIKNLPIPTLLIAISLSYFLGFTPLLLPLLITALSIFTYLIYAKDKRAAQSNNWRTPEQTLHLLALFGGWPGAILAQELFRHKTKKVSFRLVFWLTVAVNCIALGGLHTAQGQAVVQPAMLELQGAVGPYISHEMLRRVFNELTVLRTGFISVR